MTTENRDVRSPEPTGLAALIDEWTSATAAFQRAEADRLRAYDDAAKAMTRMQRASEALASRIHGHGAVVHCGMAVIAHHKDGLMSYPVRVLD